MKKMFGARMKAGSYSAFATVMVICIAVIANMAAGSLPETVTKLDVTGSGLYSLSNQSKRIVQGLTEDVNMYLLAVTGGEDSTITRLLGRYAGLSDHIKVSYIDPNEKPTFLNSYDLNINRLYANSVLVECGGRYRLVGYEDIYVTEYTYDYYSSYGYSYTTTFDGENALTNAIHYVSSQDLPKAYSLTGHGEAGLSDSVKGMLENDNITWEEISLLTLEAVPEEADAILITAPATDLSAEEAEMLTAFIDGGGSVIMITDYIEPGTMTNLLSVAEHMGMTAQSGLIVEGDRNRHINRYAYYLLPEIQSHAITDELIDSGYYILQPLAQGIGMTGQGSATVTALLRTSDSAYGKQAGLSVQSTERESDDSAGPFVTGAVSEKGNGKMIWFTAGDMLTDGVDRTVSYGNSNLYLNVVNYVCGQRENISIRAKSLDQETLTVTGAQNTFWSVVMIGVIPLGFIAVGVIVMIRRKRR